MAHTAQLRLSHMTEADISLLERTIRGIHVFTGKYSPYPVALSDIK